MNLPQIISNQEQYFQSGVTRGLAFRRAQLWRLYQALEQCEPEVLAALKSDLGKPEMESVTSEIAVVQQEIRDAISNLGRWARHRFVLTPLFAQPGFSKIAPEPKGRTLIIAPWNYPYQLTLAPLVASLAAGNCVVVKPSEHSPAVTALIAKVIRQVFPAAYCAVVTGGVAETTELLRFSWGHIFFTGSTQVGRVVMKAAADTLSPITLELGGKNPAIVDDEINVEDTARRLVWGKFFNTGQTCIAPDYLLVHERVKDALIAAMQKQITSFYGRDPKSNPDYGRIINDQQFARLTGLLAGTRILCGGDHDAAQRYLGPTLVDGVTLDHPMMAGEIFGPILPILTYRNLDEALATVKQRPNPLAAYVFTRNRRLAKEILSKVPFGGGCVNTTLVHFANHHLPFGGIGASGMGSYHGKYGFSTFSHYKSLLVSSFWLDMPIKYPPYGDGHKLLLLLLKILALPTRVKALLRKTLR